MNALPNTEQSALAAPLSSESTAPQGLLDVATQEWSGWEFLGGAVAFIAAVVVLTYAMIWFEDKFLGLKGHDY